MAVRSLQRPLHPPQERPYRQANQMLAGLAIPRGVPRVSPQLTVEPLSDACQGG
jgi:hypothetical protein